MAEVKYYQAAKYGGNCAFCAKKIDKGTPIWSAAGNIYCMDHTQQVVGEHADEHPKSGSGGGSPVTLDLTPICEELHILTREISDTNAILGVIAAHLGIQTKQGAK